MKYHRRFDRIQDCITRITRSPGASILALVTVIVWFVLGPVYDIPSTRQLLVNTRSTIISFLLFFIFQQSQNKDIAGNQNNNNIPKT